MPYGSQGLIGSGLNAGLLQQDFSGFSNAAAIEAAGLLGAVSGLTGDIKAYRDEQKKSKEALKAGATLIDAASKMFPSQASTFSGISETLKDENIPLNERAAIASQIGELINMGVGEGRYQQEFGMRQRDQALQERESAMRQWAFGQEVDATKSAMEQQEMENSNKEIIGPALVENVLQLIPLNIAEQIRPSLANASGQQKYSLANSLMGLIPQEQKPPQTMEVNVPGGTMQMQWNPSAGAFEPIKTTVQSSVLDASKLPEPLQPYAADFAAAGAKYGVDPKVLAAISMHETGNGTSSAFINKNNAMGVSDSSGPVDTGSVSASIDKMARLLAKGQQGEGPYAGKTTIEAIAGTYAPVGAENDPRGLNSSWTSGVSKALKKLGGDPSQPIGFKPASSDVSISDQIALEKRAEEKATKIQQDQRAAAEAQSFVETLEELENHPGFSNLFGMPAGLPTFIPGSEGADAKAILGKVQGKAFLEAIQKMKGMGALSEKEGQTATKAYSALDPSMSEAAAMKEIQTLKSILRKGASRAAAMGDAANTQPADPVESATSKLQGLLNPR